MYCLHADSKYRENEKDLLKGFKVPDTRDLDLVEKTTTCISAFEVGINLG
jgi:hypothetical protein